MNAYPDLRELISSTETSHPLASVRLGFTVEADADTEIIGTPTDEDHVIVILEVDDTNIEFFDATARPEIHGVMGMVERVQLDTFLRFWSANDPYPFLRGWIEKAPPLPEERKVKVKPPRRTLYTYQAEGEPND